MEGKWRGGNGWVGVMGVIGVWEPFLFLVSFLYFLDSPFRNTWMPEISDGVWGVSVIIRVLGLRDSSFSFLCFFFLLLVTLHSQCHGHANRMAGLTMVCGSFTVIIVCPVFVRFFFSLHFLLLLLFGFERQGKKRIGWRTRLLNSLRFRAPPALTKASIMVPVSLQSKHPRDNTKFSVSSTRKVDFMQIPGYSESSVRRKALMGWHRTSRNHDHA